MVAVRGHHPTVWGPAPPRDLESAPRVPFPRPGLQTPEAVRIIRIMSGFRVRPVVACTVSAGKARSLVDAALRAEDADIVELPPAQLATEHPALDRCAALLYDLEPASDASVELVEALRARHPCLPVLLYPPLRDGIFPLLLAAGRVPGVSAKAQGGGSHEGARLQAFIRQALADAPANRLASIVSLLLEDAPPRLLAFAHAALLRICHRRQASERTVAVVAADLGFTLRTLQRDIASPSLPSPKELLDWLTLLFMSLVAEWSGVSMRNVATAFRVDPNTLYRMRRRLMPGTPPPGQSPQEFDLALLAFARRCGVPHRRTHTVLDRAHA